MIKDIVLAYSSWVIMSLAGVLIDRYLSKKAHPNVSQRDTKTDFTYWIFFILFIKPIFTGTLVAAVLVVPYMITKLLWGGFVTSTWYDVWLTQPIFFQIAELTAVADFLAYWVHRVSHRGFLWRFHAIHHSSESLRWISYFRMHPIDVLVSRVAPSYVFLFVAFDSKALLPYGIVMAVLGVIQHTNADWSFGKLGWLIASPRFHRWHHTSEKEGVDKNFALVFPIFDKIFGSYYMPEGQVPERFGLLRQTVPNGFWVQMIYPFYKRRSRTFVIPAKKMPT